MKKIDDLLKSGLINLSTLARRLYPNNKSAEQYLHKKVTGLGGRKLTDKDRREVARIFGEYLEAVNTKEV